MTTTDAPRGATVASCHTPGAGFWSFTRHYLEMVVAMLVGMLVLTPVWEGLFSVLGASSFGGRTEVQAVTMATSMTVGMTAFMAWRRHSRRSMTHMAAAMYVPFGISLVPYWAGAVSGADALTIGHALMLPAMALAMLPDTTRRHGRWVLRRWPTAAALAVSVSSLIEPSVTPAWVLVLLCVMYLAIGTFRRDLGDRRLLVAHVAALVAYTALAVVTTMVDRDTAAHLIGAGWILHGVWDVVMHRVNRVVWRWYAEACAVIDVIIGTSILFLL